ncbi:polyadenylate-binding protein-interacting protein 2B isoform X1 [Phascolarctos cinereus]
MMNGSNVANTTPNAKSKEDQVVNGRDEKENNPFAEYMWMENEEDFNRQVEEELEEQEFLDRCFQEMLDEEDQDWFIPSRDLPQGIGQLQQQLNGLAVSDGHTSEDILILLLIGKLGSHLAAGQTALETSKACNDGINSGVTSGQSLKAPKLRNLSKLAF